MSTYLPGTYPESYNQINHSGALQQISHFVPFSPFWANCTVCILTNSSYTVDPIPTLTEVVLKASAMKSYQKVLHKSKGVASPAP